MAQPIRTKTCENCGNTFEGVPRQKYCCDDCRILAAKYRNANYKKKRKNNEPNALAEIARKAKAEGLSYGKYCLKYGL